MDKVSCVLLALSSGGVTVNKEVLVDIEPVEFDMARAAFVKKNPQEAAATTRSFASSRNAMTCSLETLGKPAKNSSMLSPASK